MSIFDKILGRSEKKKRTRWKAMSPDERIKKAQAKALEAYIKNHPDAIDELGAAIARKQFGLGNQDQITTTVETLRRLKEAGLNVDPTADGATLNKLLEGAGKLLAPTLERVAERAMASQPPPSASAGDRLQLPAGTASQRPTDWQASGPAERSKPVKMTWLSQWIIGQVEGKNAADVAAWMLRQPMAGQIVAMLQQTTDEQIPALLSAITEEYPDLDGFMDWFRQRPRLMLEVARLLRDAAAPPAAGADDGAAPPEERKGAVPGL